MQSAVELTWYLKFLKWSGIIRNETQQSLDIIYPISPISETVLCLLEFQTVIQINLKSKGIP
jgi:hypothetical protein